MSMKILYDQFIEKLVEVNDETKTEQEHNRLVTYFNGWKQGIQDATGYRFNGDYHYINLEEKGEFEERPMCCGEFLDWDAK